MDGYIVMIMLLIVLGYGFILWILSMAWKQNELKQNEELLGEVKVIVTDS